MLNKKLAVSLILPLLFLLSRFSLSAQNNTGVLSRAPGDNLEMKLAVMGPGNQLYFWFGHIGLVVENKNTGKARYYDWGVFSFEDDNFFYDFAFGRLLYSCMVSPADVNYKNYIYYQRDITLYTLDLPADVKMKILRLAENNILPENRDYYYHFFKDNCATRIRDIVDLGLDGKFREKYGNAPGRYTLRQHIRRHTWFSPFFDWVLNFWMGQVIDKPITVWDEMFLPSEIARRISEFSYVAADGQERPLVSSVEVVHRSVGRPAVLEVPRLQWPRELMFSLLFSAAILFSYWRFGNRKSFTISLGLLQSMLGIFFGAIGSILFFMSFFTDHDYTFENSNIFFVNPFFFALIPLGLLFAFSKSPKKRFVSGWLMRLFWTYVLLGGLLTMVIKLFPGFYQQNQVDQALVLPLALAMIFITAKAGKGIAAGDKRT